jgi:DNA mismatch endonuclease, patch repair protein
MDKISIEARSRNMAKIRAKNTKPELAIRSFLHSKGFRYRIHYPLKGKPDIVFPKQKVIIFVHGCFWHGHGCKLDHISKSNTEFWNNKIKANKGRDRSSLKSLKSDGWRVFVIWECQIKQKSLNKFLKNLSIALNRP